MTWFGIATYELNGSTALGLAVDGVLYDAKTLLRQTTSFYLHDELGELISDWQGAGGVAVAGLTAVASAIEAGQIDATPLVGHRLCVPYTPRRIFAATVVIRAVLTHHAANRHLADHATFAI